MTAESLDTCAQCHGAGVIQRERCAPGCALRHAPECPVLVPVRCPACARAELGEDLA